MAAAVAAVAAVFPRPGGASIAAAKSIVAVSCSSPDPASAPGPTMEAVAAALTRIAPLATTIGMPATIWDTSAKRRTSDAGPHSGRRLRVWCAPWALWPPERRRWPPDGAILSEGTADGRRPDAIAGMGKRAGM